LSERPMSPEGFGDQDAETPWHLMSARFDLMGHACLGRKRLPTKVDPRPSPCGDHLQQGTDQ
jgi:hypothetical protein